MSLLFTLQFIRLFVSHYASDRKWREAEPNGLRIVGNDYTVYHDLIESRPMPPELNTDAYSAGAPTAGGSDPEFTEYRIPAYGT